MVLTTSSISPNYNSFFWLSGSKLLSLNYSVLPFLLSHLPFHLLQRCCASLVVNPSAEGVFPWQPCCPIAGDKVWSGSSELQCCMLLWFLTFSTFAKGKGKLNCFTTETLPLACCWTQALSLSSSCVFYCCQMWVLALVMTSSVLQGPSPHGVCYRRGDVPWNLVGLWGVVASMPPNFLLVRKIFCLLAKLYSLMIFHSISQPSSWWQFLCY